MFKFLAGHLVHHKLYEVEDEFKVKMTVWYRYNIFKFKKIKFEVDLSDNFTLTQAYESAGKIIIQLNKITKL